MIRHIHDSMDLGKTLRECRKAFGLTQREAAQLAGVSTRLWSECENGKRTQVGFDTALRMLQTVGADIYLETRRGRSSKPGMS